MPDSSRRKRFPTRTQKRIKIAVAGLIGSNPYPGGAFSFPMPAVTITTLSSRLQNAAEPFSGLTFRFTLKSSLLLRDRSERFFTDVWWCYPMSCPGCFLEYRGLRQDLPVQGRRLHLVQVIGQSAYGWNTSDAPVRLSSSSGRPGDCNTPKPATTRPPSTEVSV